MLRPGQLLPVLIILTFSTGSVVAQSGDSEVNQCPSSNGLFRHPTDCESYFVCRNGQPELHFCSDGLHFSDQRKTCDYIAYAGCESGSLTADPMYRSGQPSGDILCETTTDLMVYPSETNCAQYYRCRNGTAYLESCSDGLLLNLETLACDFEDNVSCDQTTLDPDDENETPTTMLQTTSDRTASLSTSSTGKEPHTTTKDFFSEEDFISLSFSTDKSSSIFDDEFGSGDLDSSFSPDALSESTTGETSTDADTFTQATESYVFDHTSTEHVTSTQVGNTNQTDSSDNTDSADDFSSTSYLEDHSEPPTTSALTKVSTGVTSTSVSDLFSDDEELTSVSPQKRVSTSSVLDGSEPTEVDSAVSTNQFSTSESFTEGSSKMNSGITKATISDGNTETEKFETSNMNDIELTSSSDEDQTTTVGVTLTKNSTEQVSTPIVIMSTQVQNISKWTTSPNTEFTSFTKILFTENQPASTAMSDFFSDEELISVPKQTPTSTPNLTHEEETTNSHFTSSKIASSTVESSTDAGPFVSSQTGISESSTINGITEFTTEEATTGNTESTISTSSTIIPNSVPILDTRTTNSPFDFSDEFISVTHSVDDISHTEDDDVGSGDGDIGSLDDIDTPNDSSTKNIFADNYSPNNEIETTTELLNTTPDWNTVSDQNIPNRTSTYSESPLTSEDSDNTSFDGSPVITSTTTMSQISEQDYGMHDTTQHPWNSSDLTTKGDGGSASTATTSELEEECQCDNCRIADEDSCSKYFECIFGKWESRQCSGGLLYSPAIDDCDYPENVSCHKSCPERSGYFPYFKDCSDFNLCKDGVSERKTCPLGLFYNPNKRTCDHSSDSSCRDKTVNPLHPETRDSSVDCDCEACVVPDSQDCAKYYICLNGTAYAEFCESGLLFNAERESCDFPENFQCLKSSPVCDTPNGKFAHATSCSAYFHCIGGIAYERQCDADLHFNDKRKACMLPCEAGCDKGLECPTGMTPTCVTENGYMAIPGNCTSFFQCVDGVAIHSMCVGNQHFSARDQRCEDPCLAKCDPRLDCVKYSTENTMTSFEANDELRTVQSSTELEQTSSFQTYETTSVITGSAVETTEHSTLITDVQEVSNISINDLENTHATEENTIGPDRILATTTENDSSTESEAFSVEIEQDSFTTTAVSENDPVMTSSVEANIHAGSSPTLDTHFTSQTDETTSTEETKYNGLFESTIESGETTSFRSAITKENFTVTSDWESKSTTENATDIMPFPTTETEATDSFETFSVPSDEVSEIGYASTTSDISKTPVESTSDASEDASEENIENYTSTNFLGTTTPSSITELQTLNQASYSTISNADSTLLQVSTTTKDTSETSWTVANISHSTIVPDITQDKVTSAAGLETRPPTTTDAIPEIKTTPEAFDDGGSGDFIFEDSTLSDKIFSSTNYESSAADQEPVISTSTQENISGTSQNTVSDSAYSITHETETGKSLPFTGGTVTDESRVTPDLDFTTMRDTTYTISDDSVATESLEETSDSNSVNVETLSTIDNPSSVTENEGKNPVTTTTWETFSDEVNTTVSQTTHAEIVDKTSTERISLTVSDGTIEDISTSNEASESEYAKISTGLITTTSVEEFTTGKSIVDSSEFTTTVTSTNADIEEGSTMVTSTNGEKSKVTESTIGETTQTFYFKSTAEILNNTLTFDNTVEDESSEALSISFTEQPETTSVPPDYVFDTTVSLGDSSEMEISTVSISSNAIISENITWVTPTTHEIATFTSTMHSENPEAENTEAPISGAAEETPGSNLVSDETSETESFDTSTVNFTTNAETISTVTDSEFEATESPEETSEMEIVNGRVSSNVEVSENTTWETSVTHEKTTSTQTTFSKFSEQQNTVEFSSVVSEVSEPTFISFGSPKTESSSISTVTATTPFETSTLLDDGLITTENAENSSEINNLETTATSDTDIPQFTTTDDSVSMYNDSMVKDTPSTPNGETTIESISFITKDATYSSTEESDSSTISYKTDSYSETDATDTSSINKYSYLSTTDDASDASYTDISTVRSTASTTLASSGEDDTQSETDGEKDIATMSLTSEDETVTSFSTLEAFPSTTSNDIHTSDVQTTSSVFVDGSEEIDSGEGTISSTLENHSPITGNESSSENQSTKSTTWETSVIQNTSFTRTTLSEITEKPNTEIFSFTTNLKVPESSTFHETSAPLRTDTTQPIEDTSTDSEEEFATTESSGVSSGFTTAPNSDNILSLATTDGKTTPSDEMVRTLEDFTGEEPTDIGTKLGTFDLTTEITSTVTATARTNPFTSDKLPETAYTTASDSIIDASKETTEYFEFFSTAEASVEMSSKNSYPEFSTGSFSSSSVAKDENLSEATLNQNSTIQPFDEKTSVKVDMQYETTEGQTSETIPVIRNDTQTVTSDSDSFTFSTTLDDMNSSTVIQETSPTVTVTYTDSVSHSESDVSAINWTKNSTIDSGSLIKTDHDGSTLSEVENNWETSTVNAESTSKESSVFELPTESIFTVTNTLAFTSVPDTSIFTDESSSENGHSTNTDVITDEHKETSKSLDQDLTSPQVVITTDVPTGESTATISMSTVEGSSSSETVLPVKTDSLSTATSSVSDSEFSTSSVFTGDDATSEVDVFTANSISSDSVISTAITTVEASLSTVSEQDFTESTTGSNTVHEFSLSCNKPDGFYLYEGICYKFYRCRANKYYELKCPEGLHFNIVSKRCEPPCEAKCDPSLDCDSEVTPPIPLSTCRRSGLSPVPTECGKFLNCSQKGSDGFIESCAKGLHFNATYRTCDWPVHAKCGTGPNNLGRSHKRCSCQFCLYADSSNCSKYHLCMNHRLYNLRCSDGLLFDQHSRVCTYPAEARCSSTLLTTTLPPTTKETHFHCERRNHLYPDPSDCGKFIQCSNWRPFPFRCPAQLHFNVRTEKCDYPCDAKCDLTLACPTTTQIDTVTDVPECSCNGCLIADPEYCHQYAECIHGKMFWRKCPHGELFDRQRGRCDQAQRVHCPPSAICPKLEGLFQYTEDCHKYIQCHNGVPHVNDCPWPLEFDPHHQRCERPTGRCGPVVPNSLRELEVCPKAYGWFPSSASCSEYVICDNYVPRVRPCPANLLFNPAFKVCDWPQNVDCDQNQGDVQVSQCLRSRRRYQCSRQRGYFPDVYDCAQFFDCSSGRSCLRKCPAGLLFDSSTRACAPKEQAQCEVRAEHVVSQDDNSCVGKRFVPDENPKCYYQCRSGTRVRKCCSRNQIFDRHRQRCTSQRRRNK